jgi:IclR family transcriptional regulator, acetate operon repressor
MRNTPEGPAVNESVDRALVLLVHLRDNAPLSVTDAANHLGIAPSTAHRLLTTLVQRNFAEQTPDRKYVPGQELLSGGPEPVTVARLREIVRPAMVSVAQTLRETVQLVVLRGRNIEFVDGIEGENLLRVGCRFGVQIPAFTSAGGKALLAEMSDAEVEHLYANDFPRWSTSDITSTSKLLRELRETRRAGFGTNIEEAEQGIVGIGSVIHSSSGEAVGALTAAIPAPRFRSDKVQDIARVLQDSMKQTEMRLTGDVSPTNLRAS